MQREGGKEGKLKNIFEFESRPELKVKVKFVLKSQRREKVD